MRLRVKERKKKRTTLEVKHPASLRERVYAGACTTQPLTKKWMEGMERELMGIRRVAC